MIASFIMEIPRNKHTKAQNNLTNVLDQILFNKEVHDRANKQDQRGIGSTD